MQEGRNDLKAYATTFPKDIFVGYAIASYIGMPEVRDLVLDILNAWLGRNKDGVVLRSTLDDRPTILPIKFFGYPRQESLDCSYRLASWRKPSNYPGGSMDGESIHRALRSETIASYVQRV